MIQRQVAAQLPRSTDRDAVENAGPNPLSLVQISLLLVEERGQTGPFASRESPLLVVEVE